MVSIQLFLRIVFLEVTIITPKMYGSYIFGVLIYSYQKVLPKSEILLDSFGSLFSRKGHSHRAMQVVLLDKSVDLVHKFVEAVNIIETDLECRVNEQVGDVVVRSDDARDEAEQGLRVADVILVGVDKACRVLYIVSKLSTLFNTNNGTLAFLGSGVDHLNEMLGLSCTFYADD